MLRKCQRMLDLPEHFAFSCVRESGLWNGANGDQLHLQQRVSGSCLVSVLVLNVHVEWEQISEGLYLWGEQPDAAHILCCSSLCYLPVSVLCLCAVGDTRAARKIPKQSARTRCLSLCTRLSPIHTAGPVVLFMIKDAFDLGSTEPSITFLQQFFLKNTPMRIHAAEATSLTRREP